MLNIIVAEFCYALCHYPEWHYAEFLMLSVINAKCH